MDKSQPSFYQKYKYPIFIFLVILTITAIILSSVSLSESHNSNKMYTETLYSDVLNPASFKSSTKLELLYSYPLNSGRGTNNGFFTMVMDGPFDIPNITFDVQDQDGRSIISNDPVVGKTTMINFSGRDDTEVINLHIFPKDSKIKLKNLTINLNK